MSSNEPFSRLMRINPDNLTKGENFLLELDLLVRLCEKLNDFFTEHHKDFIAMKFNTDLENANLEAKLLYLIIWDIQSTQEYTVEGMARYIDTYEDVIIEVFSGRNKHPSATLLRKTIELHRTIRRELYNSIIKKIVSEYLMIAKIT